MGRIAIGDSTSGYDRPDPRGQVFIGSANAEGLPPTDGKASVDPASNLSCPAVDPATSTRCSSSRIPATSPRSISIDGSRPDTPADRMLPYRLSAGRLVRSAATIDEDETGRPEGKNPAQSGTPIGVYPLAVP